MTRVAELYRDEAITSAELYQTRDKLLQELNLKKGMKTTSQAARTEAVLKRPAGNTHTADHDNHKKDPGTNKQEDDNTGKPCPNKQKMPPATASSGQQENTRAKESTLKRKREPDTPASGHGMDLTVFLSSGPEFVS